MKITERYIGIRARRTAPRPWVRPGTVPVMLCILQAAAILLAAGVMPLNACALAPDAAKTVICIDPGHGGLEYGAVAEYNGIEVREKYLNFNIAKKLCRALAQYENVETVLTRSGDRDVSIKERVNIAAAADADVLISLHNNKPFNEEETDIGGCMVLTPVSRYRPSWCETDIYEVGTALGESIIKQFQEMGIPLSRDFDVNKTGGLLRRPYNRKEGMAKKDVHYPDGSYADYYGLIRIGVEAGIPVVIVEHAYISNEQDYRAYLKYSDSLQSLADADARGIAEALGLRMADR